MTWGLYLHVPWCAMHCPYCGFYVEVERERAPWEAFADGLVAEVAWRKARHGFTGAPSTIYLGGGTPSRMPVQVLADLLARLETTDDAEITIEANPEDVSERWLRDAQAAGVNRVSLGVQTLDGSHAKRLGRAASVRQATEAMQRLGASTLRSWSSDLIFALPDQDLAALRADLEAMLAFNPPHVSIYGLTIEPDTGFERLQQQGRLTETDPDVWRSMYDTVVDVLGTAGIHRYEVSNFARPGHESAHNRLYWTDQPYLGAGPSAHGYGPDGTRWMNVADVHAYLSSGDPTLHEEPFEASRYASDLLIAGMRGVEGVPLAHLTARTGLAPDPTIIAQLTGAGLLRPHPHRLALSDQGFPISDAVVRALIESLGPTRP
ncbi:MAG: radical SAM family heme chaperone HemW [Proteobacteria bacterium]|nr:radical SAM family heme chaperone HemW [Pseudomonadota bacterium]